MIDYFGEMSGLAAEGHRQGIFFFASFYTLLMLTYSVIYQLRITSWPSANGVLVKAGVEQFGATDWVKANQDYVASSLYEYSVDGTAYQGSRVSPWVIVASHNARFVLKKQMSNIKQNADGSVEVFFNPKKPKKSFLIKPGRVGLSVTFALAVTPFLLYWAEYHA